MNSIILDIKYNKYIEFIHQYPDVGKIIIRFLNIKEYRLLPWIHIHKLVWDELSLNPNAIYLLEKNQDKINWDSFSSNPSIFEEIDIGEEYIKRYL